MLVEDANESDDEDNIEDEIVIVFGKELAQAREPTTQVQVRPSRSW